MKIVLAFDAFKGACSAPAACAAAARGLARVSPPPAVVECPLSDGGEGFAEALARAADGEVRWTTVTGPLEEPVTASLALLDGGRTAVIEAAQACGLGLVPPARRNPLYTTTRGVGELMRQAIAWGATDLVVGLGGSATNDAGMGMLAALGWGFRDAHGAALAPIGASLAQVAAITPGERLEGVTITAACDVTNPLFGPHGAARIFAPQKGAAPDEVARLDAGLAQFAQVCEHTLGITGATTPGAGAAGGLGFALLACLGAHFHPGADLALAHARVADHLAGATLCLTGEGQTDGQTVSGKLPAAVARLCAAHGVPCLALSGALGTGWRALYPLGLTAAVSIGQRPQSLDAAMGETEEALADAAEAVGRLAAALRT
jgi:glycerate kinase